MAGNKGMKIENIMEALTKDALYTYEFDVTTGVVEQEIIGKDCFNYTQALGLKAPCFFDEMVKRSFENALKCRYTADSYIRELSSKSLLHAFSCGKRRLEANLYRADSDEYVRLTYFLAQEDSHVKAYVICEDITARDKGRGSLVDLDNQNLKLERDALTQEKRDLTEERDTLTQQKKDLTEERDTLTQEKRDLTAAKNVLTEENIELTRASDAVHAMLKAGSYVCTYDLSGDQMVGIRYSGALRKPHFLQGCRTISARR